MLLGGVTWLWQKGLQHGAGDAEGAIAGDEYSCEPRNQRTWWLFPAGRISRGTLKSFGESWRKSSANGDDPAVFHGQA